MLSGQYGREYGGGVLIRQLLNFVAYIVFIASYSSAIIKNLLTLYRE